MIIKCILVAFLTMLSIAKLHAQSNIVDVQVVYNNPLDVNASISNIINVEELKSSIYANEHINHDLIIRIAFFDKNVVGRMKLKEAHKLTTNEYVSVWQQKVENKNAVLFLFVKPFGGVSYEFDKMYVSTQLSNDHLFPLVSEFINEHLTGSNEEIIRNGTHYLANAIKPVWTKEKMTQAENMTKNPKYWKNRFNYFHGWWEYPVIDFRYATHNDVKNYAVVGCYNASKNDVAKNRTSELFLSDQVIFTKEDLLDKCTYSSTKYDIRFDAEQINGIYTMYGNLLYNIIEQVENCGKTNKLLLVSQWNWSEDKEVVNPDNCTTRTSNDKFIMYWNTEIYENCEGKEIPQYAKFFYGQSRTYCNVYACDLANEVLFGNIFGDKHNGPWGKHMNANGIHESIQSNKDFCQIQEFDDSWVYTNKGYVVYLTAYNKSYYSGKDPNHTYSGHIATCFPEKENTSNGQSTSYKKRVIQAGTNAGVVSWVENYIMSHIYLGYILK